ncbi:HAD domain-containing protein [Actinomadura vinacea]
MGTPVVLLDVDGVLNPFERPHRGFRRHRCSPDGVTYRLWLYSGHGRMLLDLVESGGAELAWASYWCDAANVWIGPRVGLPDLPFVPIPGFPGLTEGVSLGAWKARHVAAWTDGRPFVWFEDEPDATDCVAGEPGVGDHLLVAVDPRTGLTEEHIERASEWLRALTR